MILTDRKPYFKIAKNLRRGDILFWSKYKFPNGTQKGKRIIILSNCINDKFFIYTLPTSKIGFYKNSYNQIDIVWLKAKRVRQFPLTTVIDLKHYFTVRASEIGEKLYDNTLKKIGGLPDDVIKLIIDTVKTAKTLNPKVKNLILTDQEN